MRIVLEAGHDPKFPGYKGLFDEVIKARQIVSIVKEHLKKEQFDVLVVPDGLGGADSNENLIRKIEWINRNSDRKDILVSVHCNKGEGDGIEVFYCEGDDYSREVAQMYSNFLADITGSPNRGATPDTLSRSGRIRIIRDTKPTLAVLSKNGFVDSYSDAARPPELYAEAIHKLVHYLTKTECKFPIGTRENFEQKYYRLKEELKRILENY